MRTVSFGEFKAMHRKAMLAGAIRALGLHKRVPETMRRRGWSTEDLDLVAVLATAVACKKWGADGEVFRRPRSASTLGALWPESEPRATAKQIVDTLELDDLCNPG